MLCYTHPHRVWPSLRLKNQIFLHCWPLMVQGRGVPTCCQGPAWFPTVLALFTADYLDQEQISTHKLSHSLYSVCTFDINSQAGSSFLIIKSSSGKDVRKKRKGNVRVWQTSSLLIKFVLNYACISHSWKRLCWSDNWSVIFHTNFPFAIDYYWRTFNLAMPWDIPTLINNKAISNSFLKSVLL